MISDDDWERILDRIDEGNLLPVVGWGVTTFGDTDTLLAPWLSCELAKKLKVNVEAGGELSINDVVARYLMSGQERDDVYGAVHKILKDSSLMPEKR